MKNFKGLICFCFFIFLFSGAYAQKEHSITSQKNRLIDIPFSDYVIGEPHLAINPYNDQHLLIGAMMWSTKELSEVSCISAVSFDGGRTWKWHQFPDRNSADPWCLIASNGEATFSLLKRDVLWTYFSNDGGISWRDSVSHGPNHDHETMTFAKETHNKPATVYLLSEQGKKNKDGQGRQTVYLARSSDGGRTFEHTINLIPNNLARNTMTPVVLSEGTLILSYSEFSYSSLEKSQKKLSRNHSWTIASSDSGETFSEPRFITDLGGGFPVLEIDKSTKFKDRLYWVTSAEKGTQILSFYSTDKGEKWSEPVTVSNSSLSKVIPNIAVNNQGIVGISWYEKDTVQHCQTFMFAYSKDGGKTFSTPQKVSDQPSCADVSMNGKALRGGWSSGGHYTGIATNKKGDFVVVWADARSGRYQLYISQIHL